MENNIKIISKYSVIKEFNTPEEFDKYYLKHKEEINNKTTNQLNKEYKIKDYKITKRNIKIIDNKKIGDIYLKPIIPVTQAAPKVLPATQAAPKELKNNNENIDNNTVSGAEWANSSAVGPEWANEIQEMKNNINLLTESYNEILNILNNLNNSLN